MQFAPTWPLQSPRSKWWRPAPRGEGSFASAARKESHKPKDFQPKRRCLQHWSLDLVPARLQGENCLCTAIPCSGTKVHLSYRLQITSPADAQRIVGADAAVNGISDLGNLCEIEMSPTGEVSWWIITMRGFQNGTGTLVLNNIAWTQWSPMHRLLLVASAEVGLLRCHRW